MLDDNNADPQGQPAANDPQGGQSEVKPGNSNDAPSNIPDNLKGKTYEDIVKMYGEAQSQLGKVSGEVGELRKFREQMNPVLEVITEDKDVYDKIDTTLKKKAGVVVPEVTPDPTVEKIDETRSVVEGQIINQFADKNRLNGLDEDTRKKVFTGVGQELVRMYDPSGKLTTKEVLSKINLSTLPDALENALILVQHKAGIKIDPAAEIGSIPSGSVSTRVDKLTADEARVAKKMGLSEEEYLANKKALIEE